MTGSNPQKHNNGTLEYSLKDKPMSLSCIVARSLIKNSVSEKKSNHVCPKDLLIGTNLEFAHNFFRDELQSAIAQSQLIHPNIITTLHAKIRGTIRSNMNCGSTTMPTETNYIADRRLETYTKVMWSQQDRIVEIYVRTQGGLPPPSIIINQMDAAVISCCISGDIISTKFQSQTGMTNSGLENDEILIHEGVIDGTQQRVDHSEWTQFRPFWKISGISNVEVNKYINTCTQIVYNRLMNVYCQDGSFEGSVPHLTGKVAADSNMIETYSCPCNIYKCRGIRDIPGWSNRICPFMGHELHPRGYISSI